MAETAISSAFVSNPIVISLVADPAEMQFLPRQFGEGRLPRYSV
jgi:hypothetical protein